jgi:ribonuclease P/MRP protein subunit POP7
MSNLQPSSQTNRPSKQGPTSHQKLPPLPKSSSTCDQIFNIWTSHADLGSYADAKITKRPLHHPPIVSPYTSASPSTQKIIYIAPQTPFLSAVKRCEKLLRLSEKRAVQSASSTSASSGSRRSRPGQSQHAKRKRDDNDGGGGGDNIDALAETVEDNKAKRRRLGQPAGEEVVLVGSGRAIEKTLELGVWFLRRGEEFMVRMETGTASSIDDVRVERVETPEDDGGGGGDDMDIDVETGIRTAAGGNDTAQSTTVSEEFTRIRQLSVLRVFVSLR